MDIDLALVVTDFLYSEDVNVCKMSVIPSV